MIINMLYTRIYIFLLLLFILFSLELAHALSPHEILVVANTRMAGSEAIARYYMQQRGIPASHLVNVALSLHENMSRSEYDTVLKAAVLEALAKKTSQPITAIVLIYGIPLKVDPPEPTWDERELLRQYQGRHNNLIVESDEKQTGGERLRNELLQNINKLLKTDQRAAVDSELALLKMRQYGLQGWVKNPHFLGFQDVPSDINKDEVLLVSRLDGPNAAVVYRIINDTVAVEKDGLHGKAYFDARWLRSDGADARDGYKRYDLSLHRAADAVRARLPTVLDDKEQLFAEKSCPEAALYCGWYSLGRYIDSFLWQKGSIGYHIASAECSTLRENGSSVWCLRMLEKGVAATIGPVFEPYVQGFPLPEVFFSQLVQGKSLGEAYLTSLPYVSWQMVLIGDPLYQPFRTLK